MYWFVTKRIGFPPNSSSDVSLPWIKPKNSSNGDEVTFSKNLFKTFKNLPNFTSSFVLNFKGWINYYSNLTSIEKKIHNYLSNIIDHST